MIKLVVNTDGGSRGNPGPAALGAVVYGDDGAEIIRLKKTIGVATNNQAEYQALVLVLEWVLRQYQTANVIARLDSELVVKQLRGQYKMKNAALRSHFERVLQLVKDLGGEVQFEHVPREQNKLADQLVNEALDGVLE